MEKRKCPLRRRGFICLQAYTVVMHLLSCCSPISALHKVVQRFLSTLDHSQEFSLRPLNYYFFAIFTSPKAPQKDKP